MKTFYRIMAVIIAIFSIAACYGCNDNTNIPDSSDIASDSGSDAAELPEIKDVSVKIYDPNADSGNYIIVRPEKADDDLREAVSSLWKTISEKSGSKQIKITEDWTKDPAPIKNNEHEILFGLTNRAESIDSLKKVPTYLDYSIEVTETKICISANTDARLADAAEKFESMLKYGEDGSITFEGKSIMIDSYDYPFDDLVVGGKKLSDCRIVISSSASDQEKTLSENLKYILAERTGKIPAVILDTDTASEGVEIVIGKTNRITSYEELQSNETSVTLAGSMLSILAGSNSGYVASTSKIIELLDTDKANKFSADFTERFSGESLDGKKVMFIGNSFIYYGGCVVTGGQQETDAGWFYQICKANGEKCTVYDYTYGGKDLIYIYNNYMKGHTYTGFDYVIFSQAGGDVSTTWKEMQLIMKCFTGEPKMVYMNHSYTVFNNHSSLLALLPVMRKEGVMISNWGQLVYDLAKQKVTVPGGTMTYNKNSFIKNNGDSHHPNPLAGYITAQMTYCAITGKTAVGQIPDLYDIGNKMKYGSNVVGYSAFISKHYNSSADTNFNKVMASAEEMRGIQQLIDQYVEKYK